MTLAEFKAWLDGYLDGKDGLTAGQVAAIREKLGLTFGDLPNLTPYQPHAPTLPNVIGPYLPGGFPAVTCGGTGQVIPDWLKSATLCNTEQ
jgi:hypothetical protein